MATPILSTELKQLSAQIAHDGHLATDGAAFLERKVARFGAASEIRPSRTIAERVKGKTGHRPRSSLVKAGEAPDGFGQQVIWNPADPELLLVVLLNAADSQGVMISGAKPSDTIEFTFAGGLATFAEETENDGVGALIGLIAAGANLTAGLLGVPEAKEVIDAGAKFAQGQFQEVKHNARPRDAFGVDTDGKRARQEGGVLVSKPEAGTLFYSGSDDHPERWIKRPGTRNAAHRPDHVHGAFFLRPEKLRERQRAHADGDFVIYPWDHKFEDNHGFYRLHVHMRRGDGKKQPDNDNTID
jgi:hypothetical protein